MKSRSYHRKRIRRDQIFYLGIAVVFLIALASLILFAFMYLRGYYKYVFVQPSGDSRLGIVVVDSVSDRAVELLVPADTEFEVVGDLGKRKASALWKLARDEKKDGSLVKFTVESNFFIPIDGWVEIPIYGKRQSFLSKFLFILGRVGTNFGFVERLRVSWMLSTARRIEEIELDDVLKMISDSGETIFLPSGRLPENILAYFSDDVFVKNSFRIMIAASGQSQVTERFGKIVESLGVKPAYSYGDNDVGDSCVIFSADKYLLDKLARVFPCRVVQKKLNSLDAEIFIGGMFREF